MEAPERFVFYHQVRNGNRLGNRLFGNLAIPLPNDLVPGHAVLDLFEHNPHHDACAPERRLPAANLRVRDDMPPQFDSVAVPVLFLFHADARHYAPARTRLQASGSPKRRQPSGLAKRGVAGWNRLAGGWPGLGQA